MILTPSDQTLLRRILALGHELEKSWTDSARTEKSRLAGDENYERLKTLVLSCESAEAPELRRLARWADHLHDELTLRHFYSVLVPFERLSNHALRDDEFIVTAQDAERVGGPRTELKIVVDQMRSAFNVGAVFRTAECLAAREILLCGYTPGPEEAKTAKTAMGTAEDTPWRRFDRVAQACESLKADGYTVIALETAPNAVSLHEITLPEKTALLIGNERFGLDPAALSAADFICRIPMLGRKNSLNAGIALGIAAFEWLRQQGLNGR